MLSGHTYLPGHDSGRPRGTLRPASGPAQTPKLALPPQDGSYPPPKRHQGTILAAADCRNRPPAPHRATL